MKNATFITTLAWMNGHGLTLVEKTVFAIIYGFSQDEDSDFHGSRQYLADWCECSTKTIDRALAHLCELGFILKREVIVGGVKFCRYSASGKAVDKMSTPGTNCPGYRHNVQGVGTNCPEGRDKMSHNNISDNAEDKSSANRDIERAGAHARTRESQKFDFVGALVALGVDRTTAEDWASCRKSKGARNSESEFNFVSQEIRAVCARDDVTPQQCVAFAAGNTWRGFKASWEETKNIKNNGKNKFDPATGRKIYTGDTI